MKKWVKAQAPYPSKFERFKDPYRALVRAVVYQQLSGKAAMTIHGRVLALFPDKKHPDPEDLIKAKPELLRTAGLSRQKIAALKDVAQKRLDGIIPHQRTHRAPSGRDDHRTADPRARRRALDGGDVSHVHARAPRRAADRRSRRAQGRLQDHGAAASRPRSSASYGERWAPWRSAAAWHCWRATDTVTRSDARGAMRAKRRACPRSPASIPKDVFTSDEWAPLTQRSQWRGLMLVGACWALIFAAGALFRPLAESPDATSSP